MATSAGPSPFLHVFLRGKAHERWVPVDKSYLLPFVEWRKVRTERARLSRHTPVFMSCSPGSGSVCENSQRYSLFLIWYEPLRKIEHDKTNWHALFRLYHEILRLFCLENRGQHPASAGTGDYARWRYLPLVVDDGGIGPAAAVANLDHATSIGIPAFCTMKLIYFFSMSLSRVIPIVETHRQLYVCGL